MASRPRSHAELADAVQHLDPRLREEFRQRRCIRDAAPSMEFRSSETLGAVASREIEGRLRDFDQRLQIVEDRLKWASTEGAPPSESAGGICTRTEHGFSVTGREFQGAGGTSDHVVAGGALTQSTPEKAGGTSDQTKIRIEVSMQEISYAEAFERLGGEAELERCADLIALVRAEVANETLEDELRELFPGSASMRRGYSTKLVYQHYVAGLNELYKLAEEVQPDFQESIVDLSRATGGTPQLPGLKGRKRAKMKAEFKYTSDGGVAWYRLTDVVRSTIVYETISDMYRGP